MTENRIRITAVVKNDDDLAFIENAGGGGYGAKQAGFDRLLEFAQHTPRVFQAFLDGRQIADLNPGDGEAVIRFSDIVYKEADQCEP